MFNNAKIIDFSNKNIQQTPFGPNYISKCGKYVYKIVIRNGKLDRVIEGIKGAENPGGEMIVKDPEGREIKCFMQNGNIDRGWTRLNNNAMFYGTFQNGEPDAGSVDYTDSIITNFSLFEGKMKDWNIFDGKMKLKHGNTFVGQFSHGRYPSHGTLKVITPTASRSYTFNGEYDDIFRPVKGIAQYESGDVFEGRFENGLPYEGIKMYEEDGRKFEGIFNNNGVPIEGTFTYSNGNVFKGKLRGELPYEGIEKFSNGIIFEGRFEDGDPYYGTITYLNGNTFYGEIQDGLPYNGDRCIKNTNEYIKVTNGRDTLKYHFKKGIKHGVVISDRGRPTQVVFRSSGNYLLVASGGRNNNHDKIDYQTGKTQGEMWLMNEDFSKTYCIITFNSRGEPVKVKNYDAKKPFLEEESLLALYNKVPMIYTTLISKDIPKQDKSKKKENKKVDNKANLDLDKNNKKGHGQGGVGGGVNA